MRSRKTDILPKGLVLAFAENVLDPFFFVQNRLKKVFGAVLDRTQAFLDCKNINLRKSKIWHCFKVLGFGQNFGNFFILSFLAEKAQKKCLVLFRIENKPFWTIKTSIWKRSDSDIFLRGLSMVLVKSLKFFHLFCFGQKTCLVTF